MPHYRVGWQEKEKAGGSLVTPDVEHKYNLPAGQQYDYDGKGLITNPATDDAADAAAPDSSPFGGNAAATLNSGAFGGSKPDAGNTGGTP